MLKENIYPRIRRLTFHTVPDVVGRYVERNRRETRNNVIAHARDATWSF